MTVPPSFESSAQRATLTIAEANFLVRLATTIAARKEAGPARISELSGYTQFDVHNALLLEVAELHQREDIIDSDLADLIEMYSSFASFLPSHFASDDFVDQLKALPKGSREHILLNAGHISGWIEGESSASKNWLQLEAPTSFSEFCAALDPTDPLYWQKVYTRIGLEYRPLRADSVEEKKGCTMVLLLMLAVPLLSLAIPI